MPLDPIVSLSVALAEAPGACACLLGAGVSVDAGVPTGWDILQDGHRRLYRLEEQTDETPTDDDLSTWLSKRGHDALGYSSLLDLIAPDAAIRRELLASYFENAQPGSAHERLADLAASGVLRVFVTTNFDRLLEQAIVARDIEPVVVSDDDTLQNRPRREHAQVFIVKAHGDIQQETIRNTPDELAELPPALADELRAIVDHYGLLVIGWSGRDPALAKIVRQRSPSRYGAWWLARTEEPSAPAPALIEAISGRLIVRPGAAEFLSELKRRVSVYRSHESGNDPGSVHDEVLALVKRGNDVELEELMRRERYEFESALEGVRLDYAHVRAQDKALEGWALLAAATDRRVASLIPLARYAPPLLSEAVAGHAAWASGVRTIDALSSWGDAWQSPFWIIGMTLGGLSVRLERYEAITPLLSATWRDPNDFPHPFVEVGELANYVGTWVGPHPPPYPQFTAWGWLRSDLPSKEWLVERYPDWLRREGEPQRSLIEFSLLRHIAAGLRDERVAPWWTVDEDLARRYVQRLNRESAARAGAIAAVGVTAEVFEKRAPDILDSPGVSQWLPGPGLGALLRAGAA